MRIPIFLHKLGQKKWFGLRFSPFVQFLKNGRSFGRLFWRGLLARVPVSLSATFQHLHFHAHNESSTILRNTAHVSWTINSVTRSMLLVAMMCFKKRKCAASSRTGAHESLLHFFDARRLARNRTEQVKTERDGLSVSHNGARRGARRTPGARGPVSTSQVPANALRGATKTTFAASPPNHKCARLQCALFMFDPQTYQWCPTILPIFKLFHVPPCLTPLNTRFIEFQLRLDLRRGLLSL